MKKNYLLSLLLLALSAGNCKSQQDPQFTQFTNCRQIYNPAFTGLSNSTCFSAMYRQQWVFFPGAPKTGLFSFETRTNLFDGTGIGMVFMNDQLGADKSWYAQLNGAKHFESIGNGVLSFGLTAGILQKQINGTWVAPQTLTDPSIPSNQNVTGAPALNKMVPDFNLGISYVVQDKMFAGLSVSHISAQNLKGAFDNSVPSAYNLNFKMARHVYLSGGYTFFLKDPAHKMTPSVLIKSDIATTQMDLQLTYSYQNTFWVGISYRVQDAIAPAFGFRKGNLRITYSYDITYSGLRLYSAGSHELSLNYCIERKPVKSKVDSDRYFLNE